MSTQRNTSRRTARSRKTAISVPREILDAVDRAARKAKETRSGYISRVLRDAIRRDRDEEISRKIKEFYEKNPDIAEEERREAELWLENAGDWIEREWKW